MGCGAAKPEDGGCGTADPEDDSSTPGALAGEAGTTPTKSMRRSSSCDDGDFLKSFSRRGLGPDDKPSEDHGEDEDTEDGEEDEEEEICQPVSSSKSSRHVCRYGSRCRHKSPAHFEDYCHPWDKDHPDNDGAPRASCQYGDKCRRKTPSHRAQLAHPGDEDYQEPEVVPVNPSGGKSSWSGDSDIPDGEPLSHDDVKTQESYGAQSERGGFVFDDATLGPVAGNAHAKKCFEEMLENERKYCGQWVAFYHSYSDAALVYEVQAALAAVLFGFGSRYGVLPRLLRGRFHECPDAPTMIKLFPSWSDRDHNDCFKSVGICVTNNLLDCKQPEAPPTLVFLSGYSVGCPGAVRLVQGVLTECGVASSAAGTSAQKIVSLAQKYGLNLNKGGTNTGHMLQIFMKRHLIDKYAYAALPYGYPDTTRSPLSANMAGRGVVTGQSRIVVHPSAFLFKRKVRTFSYSANATFHNNRRKFQDELVEELSFVIGDAEKRTAAAKGVFGGNLPGWYSAEDMRMQ